VHINSPIHIEKMIIIGELLNSTRETIHRAVGECDASLIKDIATKQEAAGAAYLDVNAGAFAEREIEQLEWMIRTVREATAIPLCIDSPKPEALARGCATAGGSLIVNSISAESVRFQSVLPIVKEYNTGVIALAMDDTGMSDDEDTVYNVACHLAERLMAEGVTPERIFLDPLVRPIGANSSYGGLALNLIRRIRDTFPKIHRICGLSNVSFGLPKRRILNRALLILAMASGLDAAILDPLDAPLMAHLKATEALLGYDDYCMNYIAAARSGAFDGID